MRKSDLEGCTWLDNRGWSGEIQRKDGDDEGVEGGQGEGGDRSGGERGTYECEEGVDKAERCDRGDF